MTGQQRILSLFGLPTVRTRGRLALDLGKLIAVGPLKGMSARERRFALERGTAYIDRGILVPVISGGSGSLIRVANFTGSGGSTTMVLTVDATGFAANHTLVIGVFHRNNSSTNVGLSSVADTRSNTYTVGTTAHGTSSGIATITAHLTTGLSSSASDTITLTFSGSQVGGTTVQIHEYSGIAAASFVDANPTPTANAVIAPNGPALTTTVDDVLVAFFGSIGSVTVTGQATGWTYAGTQCSLAGPTKLDSIWVEEVSASTYTPSVTYSSSSGTRQAAVALKASTSLPVNTVAPVVSGSTVDGATLSATTGTWTDDGSPTFLYEWRRGGVNIGGATSSTYKQTSADIGSTIDCVVTDSTPDGSTAQASNSVGPVTRQPMGPLMLGYYAQ